MTLSQYIGLIVGVRTRRVYSVFNPDDDADLDNPRLLDLKNEDGEGVEVVKIARGGYAARMTPEDIARLLSDYHAARRP